MLVEEPRAGRRRCDIRHLPRTRRETATDPRDRLPLVRCAACLAAGLRTSPAENSKMPDFEDRDDCELLATLSTIVYDLGWMLMEKCDEGAIPLTDIAFRK